MKDPFLKKVLAALKEAKLPVAAGEKWVVGVSGGPDSMALLTALYELRQYLGLEILVAHLHHGLRPGEADRDAAHVEQWAKHLVLPSYLRRIDLRVLRKNWHLSLQEAGRRARYEFFHELLKTQGAHKIALGPTADDPAEEVLMRFLRGAGTRGLSGIPLVREEVILRPLLRHSRKEIIQFLDKRNIPYVLDSSNQDLRYLRNRVRHELIPLLSRQFQPGIKETLHRWAEISRAEEDYLSLRARALLKKVMPRGEGSVSRLITQPLALKRRLLRTAFEEKAGTLKALTFRQVEAMRKILESNEPKRRVTLPGGWNFYREQDRFFFSRGDPTPILGYEYYPEVPGALDIPQGGGKLHFTYASGDTFPGPSRDSREAVVDAEKIKNPLMVRNFRPGDRFWPLGLAGPTKLKDFFIKAKIPQGTRRSIPLVLSGNKVVWVAGVRPGEPFKVRGTTTKFLVIQWEAWGKSIEK